MYLLYKYIHENIFKYIVYVCVYVYIHKYTQYTHILCKQKRILGDYHLTALIYLYTVILFIDILITLFIYFLHLNICPSN